MKKITFLLAAVVVAFTINSCKKVKVEFPEFTTNSFIAIVELPASGATTTATASGQVSIDIDSLIKSYTNQDFGVKNIKTMYLTDPAILTILDGNDENNFQNFDTIRAELSSSSNSTKVPFFNQLTQADVKTFSLDVTSFLNKNVNLKDYVAASGRTSFTYNLKGSLRRETTKPLKVSVSVKFKILPVTNP